MFNNLEKVLDLASKCDFYLIGGEKTDSVIKKAEELLGFKLSNQTYVYLKKVGFLNFFGNEIYGIVKDDFSGIPEGCAVEYALHEREKTMLPKDWLPIYNFDDGNMGYLDYSQLNAEGEPPVIMAIYNGKEYVVVERVSDDLADFILQLVEIQLTKQ